MSRQFVTVKFRANDRRSYTYHWDGPPLLVGDEVKVPDKSGEGWRRVTVHEAWVGVPPFATKAVLGLAGDDDKPRDLLTPLDVDEETQALIDRDRES